jgi:hypothetical protein
MAIFSNDSNWLFPVNNDLFLCEATMFIRPSLQEYLFGKNRGKPFLQMAL